jgi:hypothetical protein
VEGVPPEMTGVSVLYSAYNGINITMPDAGVTLDQCALKWNRGKLAIWFVEEIFILDMHLWGCRCVCRKEKGGEEKKRKEKKRKEKKKRKGKKRKEKKRK